MVQFFFKRPVNTTTTLPKALSMKLNTKHNPIKTYIFIA